MGSSCCHCPFCPFKMGLQNIILAWLKQVYRIMCAALYMSVITPLSSSLQSYTPLHIWLVVVLPGCCCTIVPGSTPSMCTLVLCLNGLWIGISCRPMQLMLLIVVEWEWPVVQSITLFFTKLPHFAPTNSPIHHQFTLYHHQTQVCPL